MHRWDGNEATSEEAGGRGYDSNIRDRAHAFTREKLACLVKNPRNVHVQGPPSCSSFFSLFFGCKTV